MCRPIQITYALPAPGAVCGATRAGLGVGGAGSACGPEFLKGFEKKRLKNHKISYCFSRIFDFPIYKNVFLSLPLFLDI